MHRKGAIRNTQVHPHAIVDRDLKSLLNSMKIFYDRCEKVWEQCLNDEEKKKIAASWMSAGTLDRWRHERMLSPIKSFICGENSWLTVGDGRFGTDAHFIISHGGIAHASDISDKLLRIGSESQFINSFSAENAENLSFSDNSFDYVLIKEALHHFPRPWIALYEAFRVCRKAVILIEPSDDTVGLRQNVFASCKSLAKRLLHIDTTPYGFEPVGNFVYNVNSRELEKFLLGIHHRHIATFGLNDAYEEGIELINLESNSPAAQKAIRRIQASINRANMLCKIGLMSHSILLAALFKEEPSLKTKRSIQESGWKLKELPSNPYLE